MSKSPLWHGSTRVLASKVNMTRRLIKEEITYSLAKEREVNILHQLGYYDKQCHFFSYLYDRRE